MIKHPLQETEVMTLRLQQQFLIHQHERLERIAMHLMAAQMGSDYHSSRLYNFGEIASDAVDGAEALIKELNSRFPKTAPAQPEEDS